MFWLEKLVQEITTSIPEGRIILSSGVSPSGKYHVGTLREVLTTDAILRGLRFAGREAHHIHFVDDLDPLRKVPVGIPQAYEQYLGKPLCDIPAPDGSELSYADYYLKDFLDNTEALGVDMEVVRSHEKYRNGDFVQVIERALEHLEDVKAVLVAVSGRQLDDQWSPIQISEAGYLKKRRFIRLDTQNKTLTYMSNQDKEEQARYDDGSVKLDWRLDWPARWSMYSVQVEPFGRDHATKGGSYDTGKDLATRVFGIKPPIPVPYHFINRSGETKKMSKSAGNTVTTSELLEVLPPEIIRYFVLRMPPERQLFFDQQDGVVRLMDDYAALLAKASKDTSDIWLIESCKVDGNQMVISNVPFSHLVASYQAALKDPEQTLQLIRRTEYAKQAETQKDTIVRELAYIENWLKEWAPDSVKFEISKQPPAKQTFNEQELIFFSKLADVIESAPDEADGQWFHQAIYNFKEELQLQPQQLFKPLYRLLIAKDAGPRAGWFLSILPRDWLADRLRFKK